MTRKVNHEVNFMEGTEFSPTNGYRNKLFKPWFDENNWGVEIIDGFYSGTVVQFKEIEFVDNVDSNVSLDYHIIYKPSIVSEDDTKSGEFSSLLSLIIEDIIREAMESNETRNYNSEESGS